VPISVEWVARMRSVGLKVIASHPAWVHCGGVKSSIYYGRTFRVRKGAAIFTIPIPMKYRGGFSPAELACLQHRWREALTMAKASVEFMPGKHCYSPSSECRWVSLDVTYSIFKQLGYVLSSTFNPYAASICFYFYVKSTVPVSMASLVADQSILSELCNAVSFVGDIFTITKHQDKGTMVLSPPGWDGTYVEAQVADFPNVHIRFPFVYKISKEGWYTRDWKELCSLGYDVAPNDVAYEDSASLRVDRESVHKMLSQYDVSELTDIVDRYDQGDSFRRVVLNHIKQRGGDKRLSTPGREVFNPVYVAAKTRPMFSRSARMSMPIPIRVPPVLRIDH